MDAAGQVTKVADRLHRSVIGSVDEFKGALLQGPVRTARTARTGPRDGLPQVLSSEPQLHDHGDHLRLGPVVQILFDPAQPRGRIVDHQRS